MELREPVTWLLLLLLLLVIVATVHEFIHIGVGWIITSNVFLMLWHAGSVIKILNDSGSANITGLLRNKGFFLAMWSRFKW